MLRHGLPEATSIGAIDLSLTRSQADRIAGMFGVTPKLVRGLSFAGSPKVAHRFIAKSPMQRCARCAHSVAGPLPILRSELQGWRITCSHCGEPYQVKTTTDSDRALAPYRAAARRGETLLHNHAERGAETWLPPLEIARLLLMRRIPWPFLRHAGPATPLRKKPPMKGRDSRRLLTSSSRAQMHAAKHTCLCRRAGGLLRGRHARDAPKIRNRAARIG